jgi:hypothetical protein
MTMMADNQNEGPNRGARAKFVMLGVLVAVGVAMLTGGLVYGAGKSGDAATGASVIAGVGAGLFVVGAIAGWLYRPGGPRWSIDYAEPGRRDRLQTQRARQLAIFPALSLLCMAQAIGAVDNVLAGDVSWVDGLRIAVPVLYGWLPPLIVMGWDKGSKMNKRFLEDELTQSLRARSMIMAFFVLMAGATVSLGLGLWRPEIGIVSLPFVLAAAGATAGLRFAWLFHEAGRDE